MNTFVDQFTAAAKANLDAQLQMLNIFAGKSFDSAEQIINLNLGFTKSSLEEASEFAKRALSAKGAQEWAALTATQTQPAIDKAITYGRQLADIASAAHAEFSQAAEQQIADSSRQVIALVDTAARNAPAGSENAIALVKTVVGNASAGYEQFSKSTKQAVEAMGNNVAAAANRFEKTAQKSAGRARKDAGR